MFDDAGAMAATDHPALRATSLARLEAVAARVQPWELADRRTLPVLDPLVPLLADGGLRRGTALSVTGAGGATSLALALVAGASSAGSWVATVGMPSLGLAAAAELGIALDRLAVVAAPPESRWATVVAALVDAFDVVLVHPPHRVPSRDARRLLARARERGAVLVAVGAPLEGADVGLEVRGVEWLGVGRGHGHLQARRISVVAEGRRAAARPRRASLWLLDPGGRVASAAAPPPSGDRGRRTVVPLPGRGVTPDVPEPVAPLARRPGRPVPAPT